MCVCGRRRSGRNSGERKENEHAQSIDTGQKCGCEEEESWGLEMHLSLKIFGYWLADDDAK